MAPRLLNNSKKFKNENKNLKMIKISKKMKEFQKFVKDNFNYVGDNFAYEARSIHYDKKKNKKGIYGKASINEVKELNEEGIETGFIPWFEEKNN